MPSGTPVSVRETALRGIGAAFSLPQDLEGVTALRSAVQTGYTSAVDITFLIGAAMLLMAAAAAVVTLWSPQLGDMGAPHVLGFDPRGTKRD